MARAMRCLGGIIQYNIRTVLRAHSHTHVDISITPRFVQLMSADHAASWLLSMGNPRRRIRLLIFRACRRASRDASQTRNMQEDCLNEEKSGHTDSCADGTSKYLYA
jgi:uncharacterized heparinase superfamily protein